MLIGGFSLGRISEQYEWMGMLGQLRFLALGLLATLLLLQWAGGNRGRVIPTREPSFVRLCVGLHVLVAFSILWSANATLGAIQLPDILATVAAVLIARRLWRIDPAGGITYILTASYIASVLMLVAEVLFVGTIQGEVSQIGAGAIGTARLYGTAVVTAVYMWLQMRWPLALLPVPLWVLGIMASGSRSSALATVVGAAFTWWKLAAPPVEAWLRPKVLAATGVVVVVLVAVLYTDTAHEYADRFIASVWSPSAFGTEEVYYADRDGIFLEAIGIVQDHPWTGLGLGTYVTGCCGFTGRSIGSVYPHNLALNVGVDLGIGGLCLLTLLLLNVYGLTRFGGHPVQAAGAGVVILHACVSMFAGSYYDARFVWILACLGIMITPRTTYLPMSRAPFKGPR
jgi:O-antigen ligase